MELKDVSYIVLADDTKVKIYLEDVLDDESEKYYNEIKKLYSKLYNTKEDEYKKITKRINELSEKINNLVLFEGKNKDIPREVLNRSWVPEQTIQAENDTITIPIIKYLRIKDIQDNLKEKEFYELEFYGREIIVISKDNIYVKFWEQGHSPYFENFIFWNPNYIEDDDFNYKYEKIEDYDDELINLIGEEMLKECKYQKRYNEYF